MTVSAWTGSTETVTVTGLCSTVTVLGSIGLAGTVTVTGSCAIVIVTGWTKSGDKVVVTVSVPCEAVEVMVSVTTEVRDVVTCTSGAGTDTVTVVGFCETVEVSGSAVMVTVLISVKVSSSVSVRVRVFVENSVTVEVLVEVFVTVGFCVYDVSVIVVVAVEHVAGLLARLKSSLGGVFAESGALGTRKAEVEQRKAVNKTRKEWTNIAAQC